MFYRQCYAVADPNIHDNYEKIPNSREASDLA